MQLKGGHVYIILAHGIAWGFSGLYIVYAGENAVVKTVLACEHLKSINIDDNKKLTFCFDSYNGQITIVEF